MKFSHHFFEVLNITIFFFCKPFKIYWRLVQCTELIFTDKWEGGVCWSLIRVGWSDRGKEDTVYHTGTMGHSSRVGDFECKLMLTCKVDMSRIHYSTRQA